MQYSKTCTTGILPKLEEMLVAMYKCGEEYFQGDNVQ
jgi:hypothetical protein